MFLKWKELDEVLKSWINKRGNSVSDSQSYSLFPSELYPKVELRKLL
jgi:hypothetical protein